MSWFDSVMGAQPTATPGSTGVQPSVGTPQTGGTPNVEALINQYQQGIDPKAPDAVQQLAARLQAAGYPVEVNQDRIRFPGSNEGWVDVLRNKTYLQGGADNRAWAYQPFHSKEDQRRIGAMSGQPLGAIAGGGGGLAGREAAHAGSPGYRFIVGEAMDALQRGAAAKGTLLTGGFQKEMQDRAAGLASMDFGNEFGRNLSLAQLGFNAATNQGSYGSSYGSQLTDLTTGAGNAQAAGTVGAGNAWGQGLSNIGQGTLDAWGLYRYGQRPNGTAPVPTGTAQLPPTGVPNPYGWGGIG